MCCGGMSYTDYKQSVWAQDYDPNTDLTMRKDMAPKTCCKDYKLYEDTNSLPYRYCPMYKTTPGLEGDKLPPANDNIHKQVIREIFVLGFYTSFNIFEHMFSILSSKKDIINKKNKPQLKANFWCSVPKNSYGTSILDIDRKKTSL